MGAPNGFPPLEPIAGHWLLAICYAPTIRARRRTLRPRTAAEIIEHALVAVKGGLLALGGALQGGQANLPPDELFDEASGRWFELPHPMAEPRLTVHHCVVCVPTTALSTAVAQ